MLPSLKAMFLVASLWAYVSTCKLQLNTFRAYDNNFGEFEISYEGSMDLVGIDFSLDAPTLNTRSIGKVDVVSGTEIHGVSFLPHRLRVGDTVYYKLFSESGGKRQCETDLDHIQVTDIKIWKPT